MTQTVILITGANREIGKGLITAYLARSNTTVIATVREALSKNTQELRSLPAGPNSQLIVVSLSLDIPSNITDTIPQILKEHQIDHIDLVIANAGICNHWGPVVDIEDSDLMSHFEVNTSGLLRLFRATAPLLPSSKQPKFVYISSELASIAEISQLSSLTAAYGVSKVAGNYLVKKIDAEYAGLVSLAIDPGFVQTDMGNRGAQCNGLERAPMIIAECVQGIINQINGATNSTTSGQFIRYSGDRLPWMIAYLLTISYLTNEASQKYADRILSIAQEKFEPLGANIVRIAGSPPRQSSIFKSARELSLNRLNAVNLRDDMSINVIEV